MAAIPAERDRIDPYVDVRARTKVQRYEINLHVQGTTAKLEYDLTSNPALGQQDIVTLLLTGSIPETVAGAEGGAASSANVASNYFAGLLTGRVGGQLRKNLGLDRFEISPLLGQSTGDPTTRISVGKEVTQGVNILYSTEIGGTERQTYQIDWEATRKIRLWAQSDTKSGVSGEFQYTTRLNWGRKPKTPVPPPPEAKAEPAAEPAVDGRRVTSVTVSGVPEDEAKKLVDGLPLRTGEPFTRTRMFEGSEALRKRLVRDGRIEAVVTARVTALDDEAAARAARWSRRSSACARSGCTRYSSR